MNDAKVYTNNNSLVQYSFLQIFDASGPLDDVSYGKQTHSPFKQWLNAGRPKNKSLIISNYKSNIYSKKTNSTQGYDITHM